MSTKIIGREILCLEQTASTNDAARRLAQKGGKDGTLITAEAQTAGRGRQGRKWFSPRGTGIYMSIILRSPFHTGRPAVLSLLGAFATATAIRAEADICAKVKWPNDVIINGKKVAGVLGESGHGGGPPFVIIGIGVNVNTARRDFPLELRETATSIRAECGETIRRERLIASILGRFEEFYLRCEPEVLGDLVTAIKPLCPLLGQMVHVKAEKEIIIGKALDIDETGALIVETADQKRRRAIGGEVTVL